MEDERESTTRKDKIVGARPSIEFDRNGRRIGGKNNGSEGRVRWSDQILLPKQVHRSAIRRGVCRLTARLNNTLSRSFTGGGHERISINTDATS